MLGKDQGYLLLGTYSGVHLVEVANKTIQEMKVKPFLMCDTIKTANNRVPSLQDFAVDGQGLYLLIDAGRENKWDENEFFIECYLITSVEPCSWEKIQTIPLMQVIRNGETAEKLIVRDGQVWVGLTEWTSFRIIHFGHK